MKNSNESGMVHPLIVSTILLSILVLILGGFSVWAYMNYKDQKNNVDAKITVAVAEAKQEQSEVDQIAFTEQEKLPTRQLVGPSDLGQVRFSYPKTWSVYLDENGSGGDYEAYLYPLVVPPVDSETAFALRVSIEDDSYEDVIDDYSKDIEEGLLKASPITISNVNGTRLDGSFSDIATGSMVIFKIRDKTLMVYTESTDFESDFNNIILPSLEFSK